MSTIEERSARLEVVEDQGVVPGFPYLHKYLLKFRGDEYTAVYNSEIERAVQVGLVVKAGAGVPQISDACRRFYESAGD